MSRRWIRVFAMAIYISIHQIDKNREMSRAAFICTESHSMRSRTKRHRRAIELLQRVAERDFRASASLPFINARPNEHVYVLFSSARAERALFSIPSSTESLIVSSDNNWIGEKNKRTALISETAWVCVCARRAHRHESIFVNINLVDGAHSTHYLQTLQKTDRHREQQPADSDDMHNEARIQCSKFMVATMNSMRNGKNASSTQRSQHNSNIKLSGKIG